MSVLPAATLTIAGEAIARGRAATTRQQTADINRVPNPRPTSVAGYTANYGTGGAGALSYLAAGGPAGDHAVRATWTTASTATGTGQLRADGRAAAGAPIPVIPGVVLSGTCWARASIAQRLALVVTWFDAAGAQTGISPTGNAGPAVVVAANTWTQLSLTGVVVPTGAAYCLIGPQAVAGSGVVVWPVGATLDQAQTILAPAAAPPAYFDGDTPAAGEWSYSWAAGPSASWSLKSHQVTGAVEMPPLVAVDRLKIKWGRTGLLSRPIPSTASVVLLDTSVGFAFASRTDLLGQPVQLGYDGDGVTGTNFRGRITDVDVRPTTIRAGSAIRRAMRVELAASSREVDAAQYLVPKGVTFPAESFADRLDRIMSYAPSGYFRGGVRMPTRADVNTGGTVPTEYSAMTAAPLDQGGLDVLGMLRTLWDSIYPVPLVYDPTTDGFTFAVRRAFWGGTAELNRFDVDGSTIIPYIPVPAPGVVELSMTADEFDYDGVAATGIDQRLTRVEVTFRDAANAYAQTTTTIGTSDAAQEESIGRRSLPVDSVHANAGYAANLAGAWADVANLEGRTRRIGDLTFDTRRNGGFGNTRQASLFLACHETSDAVFARGSWVSAVGTRPLFGVLGGTLAYADGDWEAQFTPAPVASADGAIALRIIDAPTGVGAVKLADLDPTTTFGDLAYVDVPTF